MSTSLAPTSPLTPLSRWARLRAPLLTIGGLAAATLALHLRDPHERGSWGVCPLSLIGVSCPGCGGLRAVNDLTDGDLRAAASSNLLVVVGIPIAVATLALWLLHAWRGTSPRRLPARVRNVAVWVLAVSALGFAVLRNTPQGAWLAP